jgi:hypothetical protein
MSTLIGGQDALHSFAISFTGALALAWCECLLPRDDVEHAALEQSH